MCVMSPFMQLDVQLADFAQIGALSDKGYLNIKKSSQLKGLETGQFNDREYSTWWCSCWVFLPRLIQTMGLLTLTTGQTS